MTAKGLNAKPFIVQKRVMILDKAAFFAVFPDKRKILQP
jgi:hypothetical protein